MSKEKAHEYLKTQIALMVVDVRDNVKQGAAYLLEDVDKAIDIASTPQWIPVTPETMPDLSVDVIVCNKRGIMGKSYLEQYTDFDTYEHSYGFNRYKDVIAWMPMPTPYKISNK